MFGTAVTDETACLRLTFEIDQGQAGIAHRSLSQKENSLYRSQQLTATVEAIIQRVLCGQPLTTSEALASGEPHHQQSS